MTGVLGNIRFGESSLKFIHNYWHFVEVKTIHINNSYLKHKENNVEILFCPLLIIF